MFLISKETDTLKETYISTRFYSILLQHAISSTSHTDVSEVTMNDWRVSCQSMSHTHNKYFLGTVPVTSVAADGSDNSCY